MDKFAPGAIFGNCEPDEVGNIVRIIVEYWTIVMARLVQGVYQRERDRHKMKKDANYKPQATFWWETVGFRHVGDIIDDNLHFHSIFGSIFEYIPPNNTSQHHNIPSLLPPPRYVIAFRGTLLKKRTAVKDLWLDMSLLFNFRGRYNTSLKPVRDKIQKVGPQNVWLAGHSLGAAIALQLGKTMAREGHYIETYLFNPPYCSTPIEMLSSTLALKTVLRSARNVVIAGIVFYIYVIDGDETSPTQRQDKFKKLYPWIPYLFVNQNDPISCEYIGYFEHREMLKTWGLYRIQDYIQMHSPISAVSSLYDGDAEALHQIPSAFLVKNSNANGAHSLSQWSDNPNLDFEGTLYRFTVGASKSN